jgi:hypothetical protein
LLPFVLQNLNYLGVRLNYRSSFTTVPQETQSIGERALLNQAANMIFADHALTGVGLGTLPLAMLARFPDFPVNYQPAHFVLLDAAAETGIFGALFFLVLTISPWAALFLNRRRLVFSPTLIGVSALLLSVTIIGFLDYYTWSLPPGRLWQWMTWGLWAVVYQASFKEVNNA